MTKNLKLKIADAIMSNYPEAGNGQTLTCEHWQYADRVFRFVDYEDDKRHIVSEAGMLRAMDLLLTGDVWPRGLTPPPRANSWSAWEDWLCQCDAGDSDGFVQLAIFGEVKYG